MLDAELYHLFSGLPSKKVQGQTFGEYLNLDGVPVCWFLQTIITSGTLPRLFISPPRLKESTPLRLRERVLFSLGPPVFRLALCLSEALKRSIRGRARGARGNRSGQVLFLTFPHHVGPDALFRIGGVVDALNRSGQVAPLVIAASPLMSLPLRQLARLRVPLLSQYLTPDIAARARAAAAALASRWRQLSAPEKAALFQFPGRPSYWPRLRHTLDFLYSRTFLTLVCRHYFLFDEVIRREGIKAAAVTSVSGFIEKCLFAAARKRNIPVVCIQHGAGDNFGSSDYFPGRTKLAVFSAYYRKMWVDGGMKKGDVIVTGPVVFDGIERFVSGRKAAAPFRNIVIITQPFVRDGLSDAAAYRSFIRTILEQLFAYHPEARVTLKLHPREHSKDYAPLQKRFPSLAISAAQERLAFYSLLEQAELVLHFGSTAALEAMIIGRPVLTVELHSRGTRFTTLIRKHRAGAVCSAGGVAHALRKLSEPSALRRLTAQQKRFVTFLCSRVDGKAAERVAGVITALAGKRE